MTEATLTKGKFNWAWAYSLRGLVHYHGGERAWQHPADIVLEGAESGTS